MADPMGRYLLLQGKIFDVQVTLVTYYTPNTNQTRFISHLLGVIDKYKQGTFIAAGDSNLVLNVKLDKSNPQRSSYSSGVSYTHTQATLFSTILSDHNLIDIWRENHPTEKDYTYYSHPHKCFSRIDHIFVQPDFLSSVTGTSILSVSWSDHSPLSLYCVSLFPATSQFQWRLNDSILTFSESAIHVQNCISGYFEENKYSVSSPITLWEAHKVVLRGELISLASRRKKERIQKISALSLQLERMESEWKATPSVILRSKISSTRMEMNLLLNDKAEKQIRWTKRMFYACANKPGTMLANMLKSKPKTINSIRLRLTNGTTTANPVTIVERFTKVLSKLYSKLSNFQQHQADNLFKEISLPTLTEAMSNLMDQDITISEVLQAIKTLKTNKTPGPDGFTALYYKKFSETLAPYLVAMFNHLKLQEKLHPSSLLAHIVMIPKPEKDPLDPHNYRPISLLNVDIKLLTKILASRMNTFLPRVIHRDQVGFVPSRQASDNTRKIIHIIQHMQHLKIPGMLLSLDLEKAFDAISWDYLFYILRKWGFTEGFLTWLKVLYNSPLASVRYLSYLSSPFPIQCGTRQGCPLSPLLFVLAIEPLAQMIRENSNIHGITKGSIDYKLHLFADDLLLTLSQPITSLPNLFSTLQSFTQISNLKVNHKKSEALNITLPVNTVITLRQAFPFRWQETHIRYLGVNISRENALLYQVNYIPMFKQLKELLVSWTRYNLSWMGRINAVKMTILPKIMYLFRTLPIPVSRHAIKMFQNQVMSFVWGAKRPRISRSTMFFHKHQGGLGLPNFHKYYIAAQIAPLVNLFQLDYRPAWVDLETLNCSTISIRAVMWLPLGLRPSTLSPIMTHMLKVWDNNRYSSGLQSPHRPLLPILGNPLFSPGMEEPRAFAWWSSQRLHYLYDLLEGGSVRRWEYYRDEMGAPSSEYFRYMQLRHWALSNLIGPNSEPNLSIFEKICYRAPTSPKLISTVYTQLNSLSIPSVHTYVVKWEKDLRVSRSMEEWRQMWTSISTCSINILTLETAFKTLTRWYLVPSRLAHLSPEYSSYCFRGCKTRGDVLHTWWTCPMLEEFWTGVFRLVDTLFFCTISKDPWLALLHLRSPLLTKQQHRLTIYIMLAAKQTIAHAWQKKTVQLAEVKRRIDFFFLNEKLTSILMDSNKRFLKVWQPWVNYAHPSIPLESLSFI